MTSTEQDILLIDGYCGFCTLMGSFLKNRTSKSTPLKILGQEEDEAVLLISTFDKQIRTLDSVLLVRNGKVFYYSSASIRCLLYLNWWWKVWYPLAWIIPLQIRNMVYKLVSKKRKITDI